MTVRLARALCQVCHIDRAVSSRSGKIVRHTVATSSGRVMVCLGVGRDPLVEDDIPSVDDIPIHCPGCGRVIQMVGKRVRRRAWHKTVPGAAAWCPGSGKIDFEPADPTDNMTPFSGSGFPMPLPGGGEGWTVGGDTRPKDTSELAEWWRAVGERDIAMMTPKAQEYSAHDLTMTGHILAQMVGIHPIRDQMAAELTCAVYAMSKITRMLGAYKEGRYPSADSITDVRVYATMIARIRDTGAWPGSFNEDDDEE